MRSKQTCSFPRELFNGVSHSTCTHRDRINSWLLVVESQIANLTPDLSFCYNLCYRCTNGSCKLIFNIYILITFQWYKKTSIRGVLTPVIKLWSFGSPGGVPSPNFRSVSFIFTHSQSRVATQLLNGLKCESKLKTLEKQRVGAHCLARSTLKGRRAC
jgi:hypothetical protein